MFLKKILPTMGWSLALFGTGYALCGYFVGYFWNEMWLTSAALFPLLCLGALKLFREGKASLYIFILGISLFANYYVGYMCAMFIVLEFFILCALFPSSFPNVLRKGFRLLLSTLWGACLGAVLLLPALFGLLNTASTQMATPLYSSFYETMRDLFAPLTSFHQPAVIDGLPNLATTALVTLLVFLFFLAKKIPLREKITAFLVLAFLLFSMNYSVLNYFWHGMHYTNMIPYRFAFVFAFCLVVIAAREYERGLSGFDWVDAVGGILFAGFLRSKTNKMALQGNICTGAAFSALTKNLNKITHYSIVSSAVSTGSVIHIKRDKFLVLTEAAENNSLFAHICFDLSFCTEYFKLSGEVSGQSNHGKGRHSSVFKFKIYNLAIDHIIIAVVDASSVWPFFQSLASSFKRKVGCDDIYRPSRAAHIHIELWCVVRTAIGIWAVPETALRCSLRCIFPPEVAQ